MPRSIFFACVNIVFASVCKAATYTGLVLFQLPSAGPPQANFNAGQALLDGNRGDGGSYPYLLTSSFTPLGTFINNLNPTNLNVSTSSAQATDGGQQAGGSSNHALLWSGTSGSAVDLNPAGFSSSYANGLNGIQQVGYGSAGGVTHAVVWTGTAASAVDINPDPSYSSTANATDGLATAGTVTSRTAGSAVNAAYWPGRSAATAYDLNPPGYVNSAAEAIASGYEAGYGTVTSVQSTAEHAILWNGFSTYMDLNPSGYLYSIAIGMNGGSSGSVQVGYGAPTSSASAQALLWSGSAASAVNLQTLLPNGTWTSSMAYNVDASGVIYGSARGTYTTGGAGGTGTFAVEWIPSTVSAPVTVAGGTYDFTANAGSTVLVRRLAGLTVTNGGKATIDQAFTPQGRQLVIIDGTGLVLSGSAATLDVTNNDLDITGALLSTVVAEVTAGASGQGITSSAASADPKHITALAVVQNDQGLAGSALFYSGHTFDGTVPGINDILVKYTYFGDANLDGKVDGSDYTRIDSSFNVELASGTNISGWYNGDFNYDGKIDGSDYTLIDNAFNTQGVSLSSSLVAGTTAEIAAIPEPASIAIFALLVGCRRRRERGDYIRRRVELMSTAK